MSQSRTWEYRIKDAAWGANEAEFAQLPRVIREIVWVEAMLSGPRCNDPHPETLDLIAACLASGADDPAKMEPHYETQNGELVLAGWSESVR